MPTAQVAGSLSRRIFLLELEDSGVGLVGDLGEQQQVVTAEGRGALPLVAVFVEAVEVYLNLAPFSVEFLQMVAFIEPVLTSAIGF